MVVEKFHIYSVKITANTFVSPKIETCSFLLMALSKTPPLGFYHYPPGRRELEQYFLKIFFPEEKRGRGGGGEKIMELKKLPKLTMSQVLTNSTLFATVYIFSLCFVLQ